jgi:hypothetical protein
MLKKLAETARWLDDQGLFAEADVVTDVLRKYAASELWEADDEEDVPDIDPYQAQMYHTIQNLDLNDPEHLAIIRAAHPELAVALDSYVPSRRTPMKAPMGYGNRTLMLPPGFKGEFEKRVPEFFMHPDQLAKNREEFNSRLDRATRGRKRRATFDVDYASTSSPGYERTYVFDPKLEELLTSDPDLRTGEGNVNLFDKQRLRALFDPTFDLSALEEKDRADRERYLGIDEKTGEPYSLTKQLGWARRQIKPESVLSLRGHRGEIDPETNKRKPNFYFRAR